MGVVQKFLSETISRWLCRPLKLASSYFQARKNYLWKDGALGLVEIGKLQNVFPLQKLWI